MQPMCRLLGVSRSGDDAPVERPPSQRSRDDDRLLGLIRESHEASGRTYGVPRIICDLREVGEPGSLYDSRLQGLDRGEGRIRSVSLNMLPGMAAPA